MDFTDKVVLITGASSGIGMAITKQLADQKCKIAIISRRIELLSKQAAELNASQVSSVLPLKCDVSKKEEVKEAYTRIIEKFGQIDIAILNAGSSKRMRVHEFDSAYAEEIYGTNVFGIIYWTELLIPEMMKRRSGIIAGVSSLSDQRGFSGSGFYCSSKAAASIYLEGLRTELSEYDVQVITIKPGFVKTPLTDKNEYKMPLLMEPKRAASIIINGIKKNKRKIEFPKRLAFSAKIVSFIPDFIYEYFVRKFYY